MLTLKNAKIGILAIGQALSLMLCSEKTMYLTPDAKGVLYDAETKQPLRNVSGYISFSPGKSKKDLITTNNRGEFNIHGITYTYYLFRPSKESVGYPAEIYIDFENFKHKTFTYTGLVPESYAYSSNAEMNVGRIDLQPLASSK
ncbi:hypothetical protein [Acinetobacter gerneri]|uniref:Carboxypeptidase regulatory-like domain-containing protein n=1 Tax=Acinetobacter gerneri DSM 14967 = CIP 107464 = MTCC 9824 TaxID=1120926 RepID=N8ZQ35_9GAMM|nr:hypothetical protein [Acinetobacter gerneri]ENV33873.1 hypothetical protein F960_01879 [Acinetobacter gerneri DSM 14967 = CIP 107464 = MTCC 9824]